MFKQLLTSLLLIGTTSAMAQEFHFSAGYNGSNVSKAGDEHWVGKAGYQFGADVLIGDRWFLKPGLHFVVRNLYYSYSNGVDINAQEYKYTSRLLSVPVMLGINLMDPAEKSSFNVYAMGGPTALISMNADLDNDNVDVQTQAAQWYIGFAAGAEAGPVFIEGGYNAAMTNVFKGNEFQTNPKVNEVYGIVGLRLMLAR